MKRQVALSLIVAALIAIAVTQISAHRPLGAGMARSSSIVDAEEALPMTCVQAWVASGKSVPEMLGTVRTLARVSLANRELTFPDSRDAGLEVGKGIAEDCKADPHALLFAIVDRHVRRVAEAAGGLTPEEP